MGGSSVLNVLGGSCSGASQSSHIRVWDALGLSFLPPDTGLSGPPPPASSLGFGASAPALSPGLCRSRLCPGQIPPLPSRAPQSSSGSTELLRNEPSTPLPRHPPAPARLPVSASHHLHLQARPLSPPCAAEPPPGPRDPKAPLPLHPPQSNPLIPHCCLKCSADFCVAQEEGPPKRGRRARRGHTGRRRGGRKVTPGVARPRKSMLGPGHLGSREQGQESHSGGGGRFPGGGVRENSGTEAWGLREAGSHLAWPGQRLCRGERLSGTRAPKARVKSLATKGLGVGWGRAQSGL